MAVTPGRYDITLQKRADYQVQLTFTDSAEVAIDLTNWTVAAQAWDRDRTTKYADFGVTYVDRVNGIVRLELTPVQTATFPTRLNYDVLLTDPNGLKEYYLEGAITVSEGYTE